MSPREQLCRWPIKNTLATARQRTKSITARGGSSKEVQMMLEALMLESGWDEADFTDELCKDVISRKQGR